MNKCCPRFRFGVLNPRTVLLSVLLSIFSSISTAVESEPDLQICRSDVAARVRDFPGAGVTFGAIRQHLPAIKDIDSSNVCDLAFSGNSAAQYMLGTYYDGIQNRQKDIFWLRRSAESGYAPAQYSWALTGHMRGVLTDREMVAWFLRAAASGSAPAQLQVANWYLGQVASAGNSAPAITAEIGSDPLVAYAWMVRAAEGGIVYAQTWIAQALDQGKIVPQNQQMARVWYERAYANGAPSHRLAEMYRNGIGGPADSAKAAEVDKKNGESLDQIIKQQRNIK